jgi:ADP-ribose pyrophosphatase YjhB (NUDIX family)
MARGAFVPVSVVRHYPAQPLLGVSVAVVRDGRILLGQRRKAPFQHIYTLPGGLVELGENLNAAALRELREEAQVQAEILAFNGHAELIRRDEAGRIEAHYVIASFVARWQKGEGQAGEEMDQFIWADRAQISHLPLTPGLHDLLLRAYELARSG